LCPAIPSPTSHMSPMSPCTGTRDHEPFHPALSGNLQQAAFVLFWSRVSASLLRARGPLDAYSRNSERLGSRYRFAGRTSSAKESRQETDCLVFFIWRKYPPDLLCRRQLKIQQIKPLGYGLKVRSSGAVARAQPLGVSTIRTKGSHAVGDGYGDDVTDRGDADGFGRNSQAAAGKGTVPKCT
jgi:hypothetical protein